MELWKTIPEFPRYSVSDEGRVCNSKTGRIMRLESNQSHVVMVGLMGDDGIQYRRSVPLLVAKAFLPQELEAFDTPICLDGDRENNALSNLAWRPRWFAIQYNRQFTVDRWFEPINRPIMDIGTGEVLPNSLEVCKRFGLLERDLVLSILNVSYVWPTFQQFEVFQEL
jgi:NUMOD4 motif